MDSKLKITKGDKLIFLDVDGVLNSQQTLERRNQRGGHIGIDPYHVLLVHRIIVATGAKVVLSSSWRHSEAGREEIMKVIHFIDYTGNCCSGVRGAEIYSWLNKNVDYDIRDEVRYVILDDDSDMLLNQKDHFFKTTWKEGMTEEIAKKVIEYLNRDDIKVVPSPRIDYCSQCGNEHGFDCPLDRVEPDTNDPSQFPAEGSDMR